MRPVVSIPEEDRAADVGNMHKNVVKIARVVQKISCRTDRQTDRQTHSSQYFATAVAVEVITYRNLGDRKLTVEKNSVGYFYTRKQRLIDY